MSLILSVIEAIFIALVLIMVFDVRDRYAGAAAAIGIVTGLINWLSPKLTWSTIWLAPIFSLVMIIVVITITAGYYWYHDDELKIALKQLLVMVIVLVPVTLTAKSVAWMSYYALSARWVISVPMVASIIAVIVMAVDAIRSRR